MKTAKNAMVLFLGILGFKDAMLGSFLLFHQEWVLGKVFNIPFSPDAMVLATFFGICVLIVSTLCIVSISWLLKDKPNGLFLGKFVAWWMVIASIVVYLKIHQLNLAAVDFVSGVLILIPAYIYQAKWKNAGL